MPLCDCGQTYMDGEERERHTFATHDEPGGIEFGCIHCCPTAEEEAAAYDAHVDRLIDEYRERDL